MYCIYNAFIIRTDTCVFYQFNSCYNSVDTKEFTRIYRFTGFMWSYASLDTKINVPSFTVWCISLLLNWYYSYGQNRWVGWHWTPFAFFYKAKRENIFFWNKIAIKCGAWWKWSLKQRKKEKRRKNKTDNSCNNGDDDQEQKHFFLNVTISVDGNLVARVCVCCVLRGHDTRSE